VPRVPLYFPFAGRRDDAAYHDQPQLTTPSARNVRARDPVTGRMTGARRAALTKWNPDLIGVGPVRALCSTAIDDRKLEYSFSSGAISEVWSSALPGKGNCLGAVVDSQGNLYALDGNAGLVKFNSAGQEILKIALPVADASHVVRALTVDDSGRIFAAVSSGGDVLTARMWCILQLQDNEYFVVWTHEPGAYTEALKVYRGSQLFAAHNFPQENRARVLVYEGLAIEPTEAKRIESVAYPLNDMDVGEDGSLYCASERNGPFSADFPAPGTPTYRPGYPGAASKFMPPIVAWTPLDLTNSRLRIWSWYDAKDIDETDLEQLGAEASLDEGQQVLRWRDKSGNGRDWYAGTTAIAADEKGPTYAKRGPGGLPAVRFTNDSAHKQSMLTFGNASIEKALAEQQRTAIPQYTGAMWCMFILMRPTQDTGPGAPAPRLAFFADNEAAGASDHSLWVNRACGGVVPGTYAAGIGSYFATTDVAPDDGQCATADQALAFDFATASQETGCVLVTILWDGGVDPADMTKTRCLVRMNGEPIDRFEGLAFASLQPNRLGYAPAIATAVANRLNGEVCEILTLTRQDRTNNTAEPKVLTHDQLETGSAPSNQTDTEICRIEAYMLAQRGLLRLLDSTSSFDHFYSRTNDPEGSHPCPPAPGVGGLSVPFRQIMNGTALTSKHDAQGQLRWVCNFFTHPDADADSGGIGYGVRVRKVESDGKTHVWMTGPPQALDSMTPGDFDVRKVIDQGTSFSGASADGAWRHAFAGGADQNYAYPRMASDKFGNLFFPGHNLGGGTIRPLHVFAKDPDGSGLAVERATVTLTAPSDDAFAIALPPDALTPDYRGDADIAEVAYILTTAATTTALAIYKERLVSAAALATGSPRTVTVLAVTEDDVRLVTASTNTIPSGGLAALDATAQYIQMLRAGDDIVIIDGTRYLAYNLRTGVLAALKSTSAGEIPPRGKLAMYWRHRLVIGNFADAPGNYAASRLGNIRDWNQRPGSLPTGEQIQTSTQSFSGATTRAGEAEDALVAMIPGGDDLGFLVCESRILRLTGDPQDGGNIHKITDQMGGVFGESWCKDAQDRMFFFGNKPPGLYQLLGGLEGEAAIRPLSRNTLEESEFADIDFTTHRILLAWNPIDRGIHIFQVAWGTSTLVDHWFWEEKTHRLVRQPPLWTDRFYAAGKQPTAVTYLGGDDTRGMLFGCADGYIRLWDPTAATEDGDPVDGFFTSKITPPGGPASEWHLKGIQVALASGQGGARVEVFGSEVADELGPIQEAFNIGPGLNDEQGVSVRAEHLFVRVRSAAAGRWAFESATMDVQPRGKAVVG
jgi:hypothetical protein